MARVKRLRTEESSDSNQVFNHHYWLEKVQNDQLFGGTTGLPFNRRLGSTDLYYKNVYSSMSVRTIYDSQLDYNYHFNRRILNPHSSTVERNHGGIFNVSFNPSGSVCAATTAKEAILFFDPLTHQRISVIERAHQDSVNYIKFIEKNGLFASCSDDKAIKLWDMRRLDRHVMHLQGHSYWVKNLEFDSKTRKLVSSGYDGAVKMWHIFHDDSDFPSSSNPNNPCFNDTVVHLSGLMRMRLTHDCEKMVICTNEGYYLVIHDLDLNILKADLGGFHADLYHMMQKGSPFHYDFGSWFNKLFRRKTNRVELISDFPAGVDGHHITSLDVHPSSWAILSRGITRNDDAEYTFVHDIQDDLWPQELVPINVPTESVVRTYHNPLSRTVSSGEGSSLLTDDAPSVVESENSPEDSMSPVIIISSQTPSRVPHATILNSSQASLESKSSRCIFKNIKRLTHYQKEANVSHGYIKELSFSPEGRVICSPFQFGFRISVFNEDLYEMSHCSPRQEDGSISSPSQLKVVKTMLPHSDFVVTTKFSPTHHIIASGCLSGRLVFSMPYLQ